jgi:hypothetical protein
MRKGMPPPSRSADAEKLKQFEAQLSTSEARLVVPALNCSGKIRAGPFSLSPARMGWRTGLGPQATPQNFRLLRQLSPAGQKNRTSIAPHLGRQKNP